MTSSLFLPKVFINQFFMLLKTAQIHDSSNQAFSVPLTHTHETLQKLMEDQDSLRLEFVETDLYLNGEKIRTDISTFITFQYFQTEFENKNIGGIFFLQIPKVKELGEFARLFSRTTEFHQAGFEKINERLHLHEITSIEVLEKTEKKTVSSKDLQTGVVAQKRNALKNYVKAIDIVKDTASQLGTSKEIGQVKRAKRVVYNLVDICLEEGFSFFGLSNVKNYDEYTFNHCVNVSIISISFGKNLGLSKKQLGELGIAGLFHDYGKLSIPKEVLNKAGGFDEKEWEMMKSHPLQAVKGLLAMSSFQESDIKKMTAAFEHHRRYDLSGYPQTGLNKPQSFFSKIVAIADSYDAMTTQRVYQKAMLPTVALKILWERAGTHYDPLLLKAFVNTVGIYPVGSLLLLNTGEIAIVIATNTDPTFLAQPKIKMVTNPQGVQIPDGLVYDLAKPQEMGKSLSIKNIVPAEEYGINVAHYLFGDAMAPAEK